MKFISNQPSVLFSLSLSLDAYSFELRLNLNFWRYKNIKLFKSFTFLFKSLLDADYSTRGIV